MSDIESDYKEDYESDVESEYEEEDIKYSEIIDYENYIIYEDGVVYSKRSKKFLKPRLDDKGYLFVSLWKNNKGKNHKIHRLVAQYFIPNPLNKVNVDHINGITTDNRIENLRWATNQENNRNQKIRSDNTSGEKNIYFNKKNKKWCVNFSINGRSKHFGYFVDYDDAVRFARQKRQELFGDFANHG